MNTVGSNTQHRDQRNVDSKNSTNLVLDEEDEPSNHYQDEEGIVDQEVNTNESLSIVSLLKTNPPPPALPTGWILRCSHTHPGYVYYCNHITGDCRWEAPYTPPNGIGLSEIDLAETLNALTKHGQTVAVLGEGKDTERSSVNSHTTTLNSDDVDTTTTTAPVKSILKKKYGGGTETDTVIQNESSEKTEESHLSPLPTTNKTAVSPHPPSKKRKKTPDQVRVVHILKKHAKSRRPASWRNSKITISLSAARSELDELLSILKESIHDPKELRATFEELARTESDCTSAKRGGDLGFFGRRKMQPAFEKASFALGVGEMSEIVETSSGVHVLLRLG